MNTSAASFPFARGLCRSRFQFSGRLLRGIALAGFGLTVSSLALADSITLKNGDHLTGTVTQLAGGKLTLTTSYAGAVTISWDEVTNVKLDKSLLLPTETKKGKTVEIHTEAITAIERTSTGFVVTTAQGPEPVPATGLTTLRDAAAQQAYEASLRPGWTHGWAGSTNVSFALASGNSQTTSLGAGVNVARPTRTDKTSLYYATIYSHDGILKATTAESSTGGLRYDHNVNPKLFTFATADLATNKLQYLDLRTVLGGGFGWHAYAKPIQQLDVFGGVVWTHESYGQVPISVTGNPKPTPAYTNSFAALDFGQQYSRKLGKTSSFTEQAYIFPDLNDTSQYRMTGNAALNTRINSFLSWQTALSETYVSLPPAGTKHNDLILTTGLGFSFSKK